MDETSSDSVEQILAMARIYSDLFTIKAHATGLLELGSGAVEALEKHAVEVGAGEDAKRQLRLVGRFVRELEDLHMETCEEGDECQVRRRRAKEMVRDVGLWDGVEDNYDTPESSHDRTFRVGIQD